MNRESMPHAVKRIVAAFVTCGMLAAPALATGTLSLDIQNPKTCYKAGDTIFIDLNMSNLTQNVTGFQAFLQYNTSFLTYDASGSSYTPAPFTLHVQNILTSEVPAPGSGDINLDGSFPPVPPSPGTNVPATLATLKFVVNPGNDGLSTNVGFRTFGPFISELSFQGTPVVTALTPSGTITIDQNLPAIAACPGPVSVQCIEDVPAPVAPPPGPAPAASNSCSNAPAVCNGSYAGDTTGSTNDGSSTCSLFGRDMWYRFTPGLSGNLSLSLCGTPTVVSVHSACPGTFQNEIGCSGAACGVGNELVVPVTGGQTYLIRVAGANAVIVGPYTLVIDGPECLGASDAGSALCGDPAVTWEGDITVGTCPKTVTRTYKVEDSAGNFSTCTQTITVQDTIAPSINCPPPLVLDCSTPVPAPYPSLAAFLLDGGTATDNCAAPLTFAFVRELRFGLGCVGNPLTIVRTYSVTDWCGNSDECKHSIDVIDTTPPVITGSANNATVNNACTASVTFSAQVDDFCGVAPGGVSVSATLVTANATLGAVSFTATPNGGNQVLVSGSVPVSALTSCPATVQITINASDNCGNPAMPLVLSANVIDTIAPLAISSGPIAACYPDAASAEAAALANSSAFDNCPGALTPTVSTAGTCSATITVIFSDACGNPSNSLIYNTRIDNTGPVASSSGPIAACYPDVASAEAAALANSSATDNCPGALTPSVSTVGTCSAVVTVTYTDGCGNVSNALTYSTRIDNSGPVASSSGPIAACYPDAASAEAAALANSSATDNCPGALTPSASTVGTCSAVVTVTYTDGCGNVSNALTYNTRIDNTGPVASSSGPIAACYPDVASAEAAALANSSATDDCPGALTPSVSTVGTCGAVVTVTYTDGCGNVSNALTYNTRIDNTGPVASSSGPIAACYPDVASAEAAALANSSATDDCPGVLTPSVSTAGTCSAVVTVTFSDGCGNVSNALTYNTRIDGTPPVLTCSNITVPADAGGCDALVTLNASATDNCPGPVTITYAADLNNNLGDGYETPITNPYTFPQGTTGVKAQALDGCGNESNCVFSVTVNAVNVVYATLQLDQVFNPGIRCVRFVPTPGSCSATDVHLSVDFNVVTGGGVQAQNVEIEIPCGSWTSLCAKDEQHTLWSTVGLIDSGATYSAASTISLRSGDTDNDSDVDINDVTLLVLQFGTLSASGGCPWNGTRDSDFSLSGSRGADDYTFLATNWLQFTSCACTPPRPGPGLDDVDPAQMVPAELTPSRVVSLPMGNVTPDQAQLLDLDRNGVFDVKDVQIFEQRNGLSGELSRAMKAADSAAGPVKIRKGSR
ncbi:MAG: hypothetical protein U1D55_13330 [Phycisphaerae bacterium]